MSNHTLALRSIRSLEILDSKGTFALNFWASWLLIRHRSLIPIAMLAKISLISLRDRSNANTVIPHTKFPRSCITICMEVTCEKAAEDGASGGCFRRPFHRVPTRGPRRLKLILWSCAKAFCNFESQRAGCFLTFFSPSPHSLTSDLFWLLDP
jgi:hypothetical protein